MLSLLRSCSAAQPSCRCAAMAETTAGPLPSSVSPALRFEVRTDWHTTCCVSGAVEQTQSSGAPAAGERNKLYSPGIVLEQSEARQGSGSGALGPARLSVLAGVQVRPSSALTHRCRSKQSRRTALQCRLASSARTRICDAVARRSWLARAGRGQRV